jgi:hypothetical protein
VKLETPSPDVLPEGLRLHWRGLFAHPAVGI